MFGFCWVCVPHGQALSDVGFKQVFLDLAVTSVFYAVHGLLSLEMGLSSMNRPYVASG